MKIIGSPNQAAILARLANLFSDDPDPRVRQDAAGNAMFLARELEQVSARTYDVLYNPTKGRQIVPFNTSVSPGADSYSYDQFDQLGAAKWITNYADDLPRAEAFKKRFTAAMHSFGCSYAYTVQDLRAAAFGGQPVDAKRAMTSRAVCERFLDDVIAVGDATRGIKGLTNSTDIPAVSSTAGTWASNTAADKLADLIKLANAPGQATADLFTGDTLLLPLSKKSALQAPYATTFPTSIMKTFWDGQDHITQVIWWNRLNTASAIGGPRAMVVTKSDLVLEFLLAIDFQDHAPEVQNLETVINCESRVGGLSLHYPLACAKMDLDA
jgi:hypothetical protein